jgi:hypothetical protein
MKSKHAALLLVAGLMPLWAPGGTENVRAQEKPKVQVQIPDPGVPEAMTMEGKFVRAAYNNEGYVIIGYQVANRSIGGPWMMIDMGTTVLGNTPEYKMTREALSVDTPSGANVKMATLEDYRKASGIIRPIESRARVQRDSINYFPPMASQACRIGFFADLSSPAMAWDEVSVSNRRACLGRLFFEIPGGIVHGQYFLNVKFENSLIRVPFRILTEEEERMLGKNYGDIRRQVQDAFRPKKQ